MSAAVIALATHRQTRARGAALAVAIAAGRRGLNADAIAREAERAARLVLDGNSAARAVSLVSARLRQQPGGVA